MDGLVEHAVRELELLGVDPGVQATLVATVAAYASGRPSAVQHERMAAWVCGLLARRPLSPLTANPAEWVDRSAAAGAPLWQNRRDPRALSENGGRTYRLDDGPDAKTLSSAPPRGWVLALQERDGVTASEAVSAVWEYLESGPMTASDVEMLDALPAGALRWDFMVERWGRRGAAVARLMHGTYADATLDPGELAQVLPLAA